MKQLAIKKSKKLYMFYSFIVPFKEQSNLVLCSFFIDENERMEKKCRKSMILLQRV